MTLDIDINYWIEHRISICELLTSIKFEILLGNFTEIGVLLADINSGTFILEKLILYDQYIEG